MVSDKRMVRIADRMRKELSLLFLEDISDPRLSDVSVTDVKVDKELSYADIYVSSPQGKEKQEEIMKALKHASGFIRARLADALSHLRTFPELRFHWDMVPERVDRIDSIIAELEEEEGGEEEPGAE